MPNNGAAAGGETPDFLRRTFVVSERPGVDRFLPALRPFFSKTCKNLATGRSRADRHSAWPAEHAFLSLFRPFLQAKDSL